MAAPLRIALTGAQGTGKSTLLRNLSARLPELTVIPEQARAVMLEWGELAQDMAQARLVQFQDEILRRHIDAEAAAGPAGFVADRCVVDNLAYSVDLPNYPDLLARAKAHLAGKPYTHVIFVPKMFPPKPDGLRYTDEPFQEEIERRVVRLLKELGVPYLTVESLGKEERVEEVLAKIK